MNCCVVASHCACFAGYLHRDLKPANLLLTEEGLLKVGDLGQSRPHDARPGTGTAAAYTAAVATRWYRAPELLLGSRSYGPAADMWAVGCILAEMLGEHPQDAAEECLLVHPVKYGWAVVAGSRDAFLHRHRVRFRVLHSASAMHTAWLPSCLQPFGKQ